MALHRGPLLSVNVAMSVLLVVQASWGRSRVFRAAGGHHGRASREEERKMRGVWDNVTFTLMSMAS